MHIWNLILIQLRTPLKCMDGVGNFQFPGRRTNLDNSRAYYACKWWCKRGAVVEWLERCGYGAESRRKVVSSRLG